MFGQQWKKDTILYVYLGSYTCKQKITSQEDQSSILVIYCIIHDSGDASVTNNQEAIWVVFLHRITAGQLWGSTCPLGRREQLLRSLCLWPTTPTECVYPPHASPPFHPQPHPAGTGLPVTQIILQLLNKHSALNK